MFSFQQGFAQPTEPVTEQVFLALVRASRTAQLIDGFRSTGNAELKRKLPAFIFQATFDETTSKSGRKGAWRKQAATRLTGLVVLDIDHVENPKELINGKLKIENGKLVAIEEWAAANNYQLSTINSQLEKILLVYITPSGKGIKVVFKANVTWGNLADNQNEMAKLLGVEADESGKDASRMSFICKEEDIQFIDQELFTYENQEFAEKYNDQYRNGNSNPTHAAVDGNAKCAGTATTRPQSGGQAADEDGTLAQAEPRQVMWHGYDLQQFINRRYAAKLPCKDDKNRHKESLKLASDLLIMLDGDKKEALAVLKAQPWVQEIITERNEDVETTVNSAASNLTGKEQKSLNPYPSKAMQEAIEAEAGKSYRDIIVSTQAGNATTSSKSHTPSGKEDDIYSQLPLDTWAGQLQEMSAMFPCMRELFINVHPHKMAAVLFSAGAMFGTLMTRAWYHFWYDPEIMRRLNYSIFIIGDPGSGKNVIEKFYFKIIDPMIQADQIGIDAVNRYKEGRTERSTSTKAQKGEALKKPVVGIRVHPARTATGEFIRHMLAAKETVQGHELNLHMFSFDSELDNVTKNNKGGDWKDREVLELKAFHNEQDGQMYANQESVTGMFNVYWNFIYTGTPYALHRKVNQRNFGTGMSTRLAVIPLPDTGMAERHQMTDPHANETLKEWAFKLDKVEGELPIEPLNDETYEWQSAHLEIAQFNADKADRSLLKRIPYYGIGISLPYILMRPWNEWPEHKTLTMDDADRSLCRLVMEIQYRCQQFFFGEMAHNYYEDQNKEFVVRRRTTRYDECYRKLPDEFKTQQFIDCFGCSQSAASRSINRFLSDGVIEKVSYGVYRKMTCELP